MAIKDDYLGVNTKICPTCYSEIHELAEICPNCGVRCPDMQNNVKVSGNVNLGGNNLTLILTLGGLIFGVIMGLLIFYVVFAYPNVKFVLNNLSKYFLIILILFSSFSGILGYWLSFKDKTLAILEYIISSIGILVSTILSFVLTSSIPFLSVVTGISPIFYIFLGTISIICFILSAFLMNRTNSSNDGGYLSE